MRRHLATPADAARLLALPVLVVVAAALAVSLHRTGHTQGDDFALYLRQARSLFDGDIGAVVADNRFAVLWSDGPFSPIAYPWGWPIVLSPFVHLWGFDYDRLKLVEVGLYCIWLVLVHGIVRRRIGRLAAIAVVAVFATAPAYLAHTDQLLTEIPHLVAVALFVWWYDRVRSRATLLTASTSDLIVLGAMVVLAFNVRRESVALLGVIIVMQVYDLSRARADTEPTPDLVAAVRRHRRALLWPYVAFAAGAALAQFLLPTAMLPDNNNATSFIDDRWSEYPLILSAHLGFGAHTPVGAAILALAAVGVVVGVRRRPALDGPLALLALLSALAIGTHLRRVDRYWFQVTPWVVYFATVALVAAGGVLVARTRRSTAEPSPRVALTARCIVLVPLALVVVAHAVVLPGDISEVREFNDAGRHQSGPSNPVVAPIFVAVDQLTPPDAIVVSPRARTMTLLTDRRSFQTRSFERVDQNADYFAQRRESTYSQPSPTAAQARAAGWEEVWSDPTWILWRIPDLAAR